jgi:hypothetical protein
MNLHLIGRGAFVAMVVIAILATAYWFGPRCSENAPSAAIVNGYCYLGVRRPRQSAKDALHWNPPVMTAPGAHLLESRAITAANVSELLRPLYEPSFAALPFFVRC